MFACANTWDATWKGRGENDVPFNEFDNPHSHYKYLGVHLYTKDPPSNLVDVITNEIHSFFAELWPLDLKCR